LKDEFLATLSHELRTPLNAILGWSQILQTNNLNESEQEKALSTIERSARAQNQLIEDILDVSRIITGKLRLDVRAVDLPGIIEAAVDAARPAAEAKNIRVKLYSTRKPDRFPATPTACSKSSGICFRTRLNLPRKTGASRCGLNESTRTSKSSSAILEKESSRNSFRLCSIDFGSLTVR
jgi:signal transduction histidine kinase